MNYFKIIKQSALLVLKNRYLWFLGLFLGGGVGSNFIQIPSNWRTNDFKPEHSGNIASLVSANVKDAGQVLGDSISAHTSNTEWLIAAILILVILLLFIYLSVTAKGAATWAVVKLNEGDKFTLGNAWDKGHKYFWRKLSYDIIICAGIIVILSILATPVIILAIYEMIIPAIILGILFGLAFIIFAIYLSLFLPYSERILFLDNKKNLGAVKAGFNFFNKNWGELLIVYLLLFGIGMVAAMILVIAFIVCALAVFAIGGLFYLINHALGFAVGGLIGSFILLAFIVLGGTINSFSWSVITLAYQEAKQK